MMIVTDALFLLDELLDDKVKEKEIIEEAEAVVDAEIEAELGEVEVEVEVKKVIIEGGVRLPQRDKCEKCGNLKNSLDPWDICLCKFELKDLPDFKRSVRVRSLISKTYKEEAKRKKGFKKKPVVYGMSD